MPYINGYQSYFDEASKGFDSSGLSSGFKLQRDLVSFGKLSTNDTSDWYQLRLDAPGHYTILVSTDPTNNYSAKNLWQEHGSGIMITLTDRYGTPISTTQQGFANLSTDGHISFDYFGNAANGEFYVRVDNLLRASTDYVLGLEADHVDGLDIFGTYRDDTFRGSVGDDHIETYGGDDTIFNNLGNDYFNGGSGLDFLVMSGKVDEYRISGTASNFQIEDKLGDEGRDQVQNIERLIFSDYALAFDFNGAAGQAYRLYSAAFDRTPDIQGLSYWIDKLDHGMDLERVANAFYQSNEFQSRYGSYLSNEKFVTTPYNNVLHRAPDIGGFNYWNYKLSSGDFSRAEVLLKFSESPEHQAKIIGQIQDGIEYIDFGA